MRRLFILCCCIVLPVGHALSQEAFEAIGTYPLEGEALKDSFIVYFSDPVDWEQLDDAPVRFEPKLKGQFDYGNNYVLFRPDTSSLKSRAVYEATLSPTIRSTSSAAIAVPDDPIRVVTHSVALAAATFSGEDEARMRISLRFTDRLGDVAPDNDLISIVDANGLAADSTVMKSSKAGILNVEFPREIALPATLTVLPGLETHDGRFVVARPQAIQFPATDPLTVRQAIWNIGGSDFDRVIVQFSGNVAAGAVEDYITIHRPDSDEPLAYQVETTDDRATHQLLIAENVAGVEELELRIRQGLVSREMKRFPEDHVATLKRNRGRPNTVAQNIRYHSWRNKHADGAELELRFARSVSAPEMKDRISVEPAIADMEIAPGPYGHSLLILGDWDEDESYRVVISEGTSEGDQRTLQRGVGKPPHAVGVTFSYSDKYFFPRSKPGSLELKARGVSETTLLAYRLFPNNIVPAMQYITGENVNATFNGLLAQPTGKRTLKIDGKRNETIRVPVDVEALLGDSSKGIFSFQIEGHHDYRNTKIVLWTDIGAVAHWQSDALAIYAHDLYSLEPLAGATVTVYSSKNQEMASGITNADGILLLKELDDALGMPVVATIVTPDDFSFIELKSREAAPDSFNLAGGIYDADAYDTYMYSDRSVYRPGETARIRWIVRTNYGDALTDVPLLLQIRNAQNQEVLRQPMTLSEFGTGHVDFETKKTFATGRYMAFLKIPGSDRALRAHSIRLEEFVANKITATIAMDRHIWASGSEQHFSLAAENLFGGPAANRKSEGSVILRKGRYVSKRWKSFVFTNDAPFEPVVHSLGEQTTDDEGRAMFTFVQPDDLVSSAPLSVMARGQVFELGGRAVTATAGATLFPSDTALGLSAESVNDGQSMRVRVVAMRPDESPAALENVRVTLERRTWHYTIRRFGNQNRHWWERSYEPVESLMVDLKDGLGECELELPYYGRFRVRVSSGATPQYSTQRFYKYGNRLRLNSGDEPSLVSLSLDRESYYVGDTAVLKIESPFPGKAVVCLQGETIESLDTVELVDNRAEVRIPLESGYAPNVWAEVTVVHEDGDGKTHPYSSFSVVNIPVLEAKRRLTLSYSDLPEEVRPAQQHTVRIKVEDSNGWPARAEITLAAVDEGIHTILGYRNPDPATWFERSRRPAFNRATYYDRVAYNFDASEIGGGMLAKRLSDDSSVSENWINPVALWSGIVETDETGYADVELDIPEFNGQLRLVAVGASTEASGAVSEQLFVRRPYILRTSMPRFVLPGDRFVCSAVVFNTTKDNYTARLRWLSDGALNRAEEQRELGLSPGSDQQVRASFVASSAAGQGRIEWEVDILDDAGNRVETLKESVLIPVLHPAVYQTNHEFAVVKPGDAATFQNTLFVDSPSANSSITVSGNPVTRLSEALDYVVRYPYGCVEQTTSACMPLYLLRQNEEMVESSLGEGVDVLTYLQDGIDRLFSMQTSSGGLAYWPGGSAPNEYGSIYACHFLTIVQGGSNLTFPESQFRELQRYVKNVSDRAADRSMGEYYRRAYAMYVLALDCKVSRPEEIERFDTVSMATSARYWLAAALALSTRDANRATEYLSRYPRVRYDTRETSDNFNSAIRGVAIELMTMLEMDGDEGEMALRVDQLIRFLETERYPNTQEYAFVATALGRYLNKNSADLALASAVVEHDGNPVTLEGKAIYSNAFDGLDSGYRVVNTGSAPLYVNYVTAGIPNSPVIGSEANGIRVSRRFRESGDGAAITSSFIHGNSYLVTIDMECAQSMNNVVVADLLPAGFEIENPRIDESNMLALKIPKQSASASYVDVRDDRLVLAFDRLSQGSHRFHYVVRAVTPGEFQHPGVVAECMYDAQVRGNSELGSVSIIAQ